MRSRFHGPDAFLTRELLCFIRDANPTAGEFIAQYGGSHGQCFHILRKHGIIVEEEERIRLSRRHLSPDGQRFVWNFRVIHLDRDEVEWVDYGPGGHPPVFSEDA